MAYPNSPEVRLEGGSGLDNLIKNTEFENTQHTKAIETERERIETYKSQLEEKKRRTEELNKSTTVLEEQAQKLEKQFVFNQENIESLKRTSSVLTDHEEALRRKLLTLQHEVEQENSQQNSALSKYEGIWATYQAKYESKEKVKQLLKKREELRTVQEHNAQLAKEIHELEQVLNPVKQSRSTNSILVSWVLQIAQLRCSTNHHLSTLCAEMATASNLRQGISRLEVRVREAEAVLERREMEAIQQRENEAKQHQQANDLVAMDTDAPPTSTHLSSPTDPPPQPDMYNYQLPQQHTHNSNKPPPPNPLTIPKAAATTTQANLFPPPCGPTSNLQLAKEKQPTASAVVNSDPNVGQQKRPGRFVFEMPTLSKRPQRSFSSQSSTPSASRAQLSSLTVTRSNTNSQPVYSSSTTRRPSQIQMPTLHTPRPKPASVSLASTRHNSESTLNRVQYTPATTTPKPSLQFKLPSQVELSKPLAAKPSVQPPSSSGNYNTLAPYQDSIQPPSRTQDSADTIASIRRSVSPPKAVEAETYSTTATAAQPSQEPVNVVENSHRSKTSYPPHQVNGQMSVSEMDTRKEIDQNRVAEGDAANNIPNVPNVPVSHTQEPLPQTTPTQLAACTSSASDVIVNTSSMAGSIEMADPVYSESSINSFNVAAPQQMEANNCQDPVGAYPLFGGEMYQQPIEGMQMGDTISGQFFTGGVSEGFNQTAGGDAGFGSGFFSTQDTSTNFGSGFFFGGPPETPQQQPESSGFAFSFGGGTTSSSNSPFSFSF